MNGEKARILKVTAAYLNLLSWHSHGKTEENQEKYQDIQFPGTLLVTPICSVGRLQDTLMV
jgi:hypothetical protein